MELTSDRQIELTYWATKSKYIVNLYVGYEEVTDESEKRTLDLTEIYFDKNLMKGDGGFKSMKDIVKNAMAEYEKDADRADDYNDDDKIRPL